MEWNGNFGMEYGRCQNDEKLVMQNSRREPHSSVTVRRLRGVGGKLNFFGKLVQSNS